MDDPRPIGARLREARMRQGLDLSDCAAATRIRERYLVAIEDDRFESLPDPAYVNGFLRAYAAHLGVPFEGPERHLPAEGAVGPRGGRAPCTSRPPAPRPARWAPARRAGAGCWPSSWWPRRVIALLIWAGVLNWPA